MIVKFLQNEVADMTIGYEFNKYSVIGGHQYSQRHNLVLTSSSYNYWFLYLCKSYGMKCRAIHKLCTS